MNTLISGESDMGTARYSDLEVVSVKNHFREDLFDTYNPSRLYCGLGKCYGNNGWCDCGHFQEQPGNTWWCKCGHHYNEHGS